MADLDCLPKESKTKCNIMYRGVPIEQFNKEKLREVIAEVAEDNRRVLRRLTGISHIRKSI